MPGSAAVCTSGGVADYVRPRAPSREATGALGVVRVDQPLATVNGPAVPVTPLTVTVTQI